MMEVARDAAGRMPRIFGVNHHPEIVDRANLMAMLKLKLERGEVTREWYEMRRSTLALHFSDAKSDGALDTTSDFTFRGPLRFHVTRAARLRAEARSRAFPVHESQVERALTAQ